MDYDIGCCIWQQTQGSDTWVVLLLSQWMKTTGQSEMCLKDLLLLFPPSWVVADGMLPRSNKKKHK